MMAKTMKKRGSDGSSDGCMSGNNRIGGEL